MGRELVAVRYFSRGNVIYLRYFARWRTKAASVGIEASRSKKPANSFFVLEEHWQTRKFMGISGGSFLLLVKSLSGFAAYS